MNIDLIKLVTNQEDTIKIDSYIDVPFELVNSSNIRKLEDVRVIGTIKKLFDEYEFVGNISGQMILADDLTLEDVVLPINIDFDEYFAEGVEDNENNLIIIQNRLDIIPFLWQNIVLEVPLKVSGSKDRDLRLEGDGWRVITEEELNNSSNSPFSNLQSMIDSRKE